MITVKDLREAMEGLPDEAPVCLLIENDPEPFVDIDFLSAEADGDEVDGLFMIIHAIVNDSEYEDEDDEEDE